MGAFSFQCIVDIKEHGGSGAQGGKTFINEKSFRKKEENATVK